ncbi:MAG: Rpn family recombination-promoting nuclease/putative transposase [Prevotellaceae bacterium]|jgi:predicted transposase/invertase (TIGR01784 family)|nr:Rpn family recombination-promoting nuclease/putative transposase [Prevotellaceae bacterium]
MKSENEETSKNKEETSKNEEEISKNKKERQLVSFDWAVKRLLRNKANFEIVEGFLSELLNREIKITNVLESESNKADPEDKHNRIDIVVEDTEGEIILIELQFIPEMDYFQRMLYGVSKTIVDHMVQGDKYLKIKKIYSINIVYFDLGQEDEDDNDYVYSGETQFKGFHSKKILNLSKKQQKIFGKIEAGNLYPEYYILKTNNFDDVATTTLDEWVYFLKNDRIEDGFKAKGLLKAREILDYSRLSPQEKASFDYEQDRKSHERSQIATAKDEGRFEIEEKYSKTIEEKDKTIEEQGKAIEEQGKAFAKAIEEKDKAIEEQGKAIEEQGKAFAKAIEEKDKSIEEQGKALEKQAQEIEKLKRFLNIK